MVDRRWAMTKLVRPLHQGFHAFLDQRFGQRIHRTGGFIHDKDFRVGQDCPRQADQLFLTDREQVPAFADRFLIPFWKTAG